MTAAAAVGDGGSVFPAGPVWASGIIVALLLLNYAGAYWQK